MTPLVSSLPLSETKRRQSALSKVFWAATCCIVVIVTLTAHPQYAESALGAFLVISASLFPFALWVAGKVKGLPLFPVYAVTHLWTFGLPLLYEHPVVSGFPPNDQLIGALTVTGFLLVGTFVWSQIARKAPRQTTRFLVLNPLKADVFFLVVLCGGILLTISTTANWFQPPEGISSLVRAGTLALEALACFALSYRLGNGALAPEFRFLFKALFTLLLVVTLPGLLLINTMSLIGVAGFGYTIGARRFPWRMGIVSACVFAFLHGGKSDMREMYWLSEGEPAVQPLQYPVFITEWISTSSRNLFSDAPDREESGQSLLERASLMHLLLYVQSMTPGAVPYLDGATYTIIPQLLVPRFLNPEKIRSHEGTYILAMHYGIQSTTEETQRTTIGFGLLNEAYANFGFLGIGMLSLFMGAYYGAIGRWAGSAPVLSMRSLFAILVASYSFQTEFAAGVYVAALFQSVVAFVFVTALFVRPKTLEEAGGPMVE